jgi:hypothetical protein
MAHILIGALAVAVIWFLVRTARRKNLILKWWAWALAVLCLFYMVFVLELIVGFLGEGAPRAALVMGSITGLPAVIWGLLLGRFVFTRPDPTGDSKDEVISS